jgi:predicted ATPase
MKLIVKNLGAIKEGTIDLSKKVYLFVGYNNSGKTYMSKLIFTIFHDDTMLGFPSEELVAKMGNIISNNKIELTDQLVKDLLDGFAKHVESKFLKALNLTKDQPAFRNFSLGFKFTHEEIINHTFAVNSHSGVKGKPYSVFSLKKFKGTKEVVYEENSLNNLLLDLTEDDRNILEKTIAEKKSPQNINNTLILFLLRSLLQNEKEPVFFPADRVFYLKHKRSIFSEEYNRKKNAQLKIQELIEQANEKVNLKELLNLLKPSFTNAEDILIRKIVGMEDKFLNNKLAGTPYFSTLITKLEKIMGGEVILKRIDLPTGEKEVEYSFKFDMNTKETDELPLALSSSAVNQLSTIYLLLKYVISNEPSFLFIDEPEENLHPQNQITLLNSLLEFASMNKNRLLLTTHSPLLAEHLNNYLYASYIRNEKQNFNAEVENLTAFNPDVTIDSKDVAIYFFENNHKLLEYKHKQFGVAFSDFNAEKAKISELKDLLTEQIYELGK